MADRRRFHPVTPEAVRGGLHGVSAVVVTRSGTLNLPMALAVPLAHCRSVANELAERSTPAVKVVGASDRKLLL